MSVPPVGRPGEVEAQCDTRLECLSIEEGFEPSIAHGLSALEQDSVLWTDVPGAGCGRLSSAPRDLKRRVQGIGAAIGTRWEPGSA
jgi:hypothetical protein